MLGWWLVGRVERAVVADISMLLACQFLVAVLRIFVLKGVKEWLLDSYFTWLLLVRWVGIAWVNLQVDFSPQWPEIFVETLFPRKRQIRVVDVERFAIQLIPAILKEGKSACFGEPHWLLDRLGVPVWCILIVGECVWCIPALHRLHLEWPRVILLACYWHKFTVQHALGSCLVLSFFTFDTFLQRSAIKLGYIQFIKARTLSCSVSPL